MRIPGLAGWLVAVALVTLLLWPWVNPCQANSPKTLTNAFTATVTSARVTSDKPHSSKLLFQAPSLSLSINTDKTVCLTNETIQITVTTNVGDTYVTVEVELPGGYREQIGEFRTSSSYTLTWSPKVDGRVTFVCKGRATVMVWTTCIRTVCIGKSCWFETYPCLQPQTVTDDASCDLRVYRRTTSISGRVIDTNNRPVSGATVSLSTTRQATSTRDDGSYEFYSYELGNNYNLINQIPTVTETVFVEAIACEPQPGKTIQVQAERVARNVDFTLNRSFYPPNIDLSQFTFVAFSGWSDARQYSTWQNILGLTVEKPTELKRLLFGTRPIASDLSEFDFGNKKLFLVTNPKIGRYFIELEGDLDTEYSIGVAATLNGKYYEPQQASGPFERNIQRLRLEVRNNGVKLVTIEAVNVSPWIAAGALGLVAGLVAAYFVTVRRAGLTKKGRAGIKFPKIKWPKIERVTGVKSREDPTKIFDSAQEIQGKTIFQTAHNKKATETQANVGAKTTIVPEREAKQRQKKDQG